MNGTPLKLQKYIFQSPKKILPRPRRSSRSCRVEVTDASSIFREDQNFSPDSFAISLPDDRSDDEDHGTEFFEKASSVFFGSANSPVERQYLTGFSEPCDDVLFCYAPKTILQTINGRKSGR
jgi:hypothetical protein